MADEKAEQDPGPVDSIRETTAELRKRLEELQAVLRDGTGSAVLSSSEYCQQFCTTLLEFAGRWRIEEEPLPVVQVYIVALLSYAEAAPFLSLQCENVSLVVERLSLSFLELLLSLTDVPDDLWKQVQSSVQFAHEKLQENGLFQLSLLSTLSQNDGVWTNKILQGLLLNHSLQSEQVEEFLLLEGPVLLQMRVKQLMKEKQMETAAFLSKTCSESSGLQGKEAFRQMYLVCLCATSEQDQLMEKLSKEDCRDALEMICNLDSDGDDRAAFSLCSAFLTRQLLRGDTYCAWELTLFWSKLLKRLEPSDQAFLDRCRQMSLVSKSVYHILFLIKVIQSEITHVGLSLCIEMCVRALRIKSEDDKAKGSVYKTISCLLSSDLEVKRACQLTEFLLEPTVDAYYAVESLYNEPDQKLEEDNMPIPNSLRCELLLVLKTQWPFDPEFWDWKTLKRHCLALMGEEASIVSSIDSLNEPEEEEDYMSSKDFMSDHMLSGTNDLEITAKNKEKTREMKKLRNKNFTSTQFRNWQVYMQYCVLCDKEFLGHRIVRHAQIHLSNGIYSCPICAQTFTSKDTLIPHVTLHVKQSCKERLTAMKTNKSLACPETSVPPVAALKISTYNEPHKNNSLQLNGAAAPRDHSKKVNCRVEINEDNLCPVGQCRRSFKFFKNLIAHVKDHGDDEEAKTFLELQSKKVVCQYCRRHFISVTHLNDHLQVHCGVKPYICVQLNCKASFLSNAELLIHKKKHTTFKARCMFPNCGKIFDAAFRLYDHEAHHYKTFTCKVADCGKVFHSQQQLDLHCEKHDVQKEESPSLNPSLTTAKSDPPPTKQMASNLSAQKQGDPQQNTAAGKTHLGVPSVSSENLLESQKESAETLTQPQNIVSPISQMYNSNNSVIQSVHSHLAALNKHKEDFGPLGCMTPPQKDPSVPLFKAKNSSQNQPQTFNVNDAVISYSSNSNLPLKISRRPMSCRNVLAVSLSRIPTDPAMSLPKSRVPTDPSVSQSMSRVPTDPSVSQSMSRVPTDPSVSQSMSRVPTDPSVSQSMSRVPTDASVSQSMSLVPTDPSVSQSMSRVHTDLSVSQQTSRPSKDPSLSQPLSQTPTDPTMSQPVSRYPTDPTMSQPVSRYPTDPTMLQPVSRYPTDPIMSQVSLYPTDPTMSQPVSRYPTDPTMSQPMSRYPTDPTMSQPMSRYPTDPTMSQPMSRYPTDPTMSQLTSQLSTDSAVSQPTYQFPTNGTMSQLLTQTCTDPTMSRSLSQIPTNPTMSPPLSQTSTDPAISQPTSRFFTDRTVSQQINQSSIDPMSQPLSRTFTGPTMSQPLSLTPTDPTVPQPLSQTSTDPTLSQPLPPTVSPQQLPGSKLENSLKSSNIMGPSLPQRQRFHCAFGTCSRHYSSYRSVTKHMKAVHPDFYEQWTVAPTEIRISYVSARVAPSVGLQNKQANMVPAHGVQRQNIIQSPPYSNRSSNHPSVAQQSPPSLPHNLNGSLLLANVLNPIVLSQLGAARNPEPEQSQDLDSDMCHSAGHEQTQNCGSSSVFSSNQQVMPLANSTGSIPSHSVPSCSMMGSAINSPESSQSQPNLRPQSVIPSFIKSAQEVSQQVQSPPKCTSLMQSNLVSASRTSAKIKPEQLSFSSVEENQNNQPPYGTAICGYGPENPKPARKHTRTKCPAIVKDGKFVCRRCFREFDNPKSLGGHLSKRTSCKPYQESELNTNLPQSFLDFLNSEPTGSIAQPQTSDSDAAMYHKLNETMASGSPATKDYSTTNYSQNNLPAYENGESNDDILKQIMSESNMSDLFVPGPAPQPFQNFCSPLAVSEHLQGTSVIQHTENVQMKPKGNTYTSGHCPRPGINRFAGNEFSDLVLSHPLTDNPSTAVTGGESTNNITPGGIIQGEGYPFKTSTTTPDAGTNLVMLPDGQLSQAATGCKQNKTITKEKNIRKRLREQILAGDFQRRNVCPVDNTDIKFSNLGTETSPSKDGDFQQFLHDADIDSVIKGNSVVIPGSSDELKQLLNTQSFTCFRERRMVHQELPSPTVIPSSDLDPTENDPNPGSHQQCLTEIQLAFERLNLVREKFDHSSSFLKENGTDKVSQTASSKVESQILGPPFFVKPFACEICAFSSVSCESLWKHLSKAHNYTHEMVNDVKRKFGLYAPFKCQKCFKAFTRNSNLRHHYLSIHKLAYEEIAVLDMQRRKAKTAATSSPNQSVSKNSQASHSSRNNGAPLYPPPTDKAINNPKSQCDSHCSVIRLMHNPGLSPSGQGQSTTMGSMSVQAGMSTEHWLQQQRNVSQMHSQHFPSIQNFSATSQNTVPITPKKGSLSRQVQPKTDITKKTKVKKSKSESSVSQYRPYRCVHQGCMAAFTIQHNLILHYRSVHQSALSALEVNKDQEQTEEADESVDCDGEQEEDFPQITEFRCQAKDCCCVFQEAPNLFLHYLLLHEFSLDKVDRLLSSIRYGRFSCGHQGCTESFTAFRKYVDHVKEEHKDLNVAKSESFKCEVDGCNRSYTTKSNLLRHVLSKHSDMHQQKLKVQTVKYKETKHNSKSLHYQITKTSDGKENIENNKKIPLRANHRKRVNKSRSKHWLKYGKPSLKSKVDAIALCTKKFPLQYPCMIKSCMSVMKSERDILKHYIGHGLSEKYLEQHRSHFIFCKKFPRLKCRSIRSDDSKSDNTSDLSDNEMASDPVLEGGDREGSKPVLRRRIPVGMPVVLLDSKLPTDQHSCTSLTLKRKRGRPRKLIHKIVKRKKILHPKKVSAVHCKEEEPKPSEPPVDPERTEQSAPLASFKPMGFEMSFLKFLEQSNKPELSFVPSVTITEKGKTQSNLKAQNTCVRFNNRQNLKSLGKVKIHLGTASEHMLKQLQDMRPTVVLERYN